ncbi:uncharacterized protein LOC143017792 [Oratosquilla oratoria]|uniref:uncharacterized protein LOC143017792 n=1 Tax=Oratosquilla oratoria TaxID=337810 RepID=UPI003F773EC0
MYNLTYCKTNCLMAGQYTTQDPAGGVYCIYATKEKKKEFTGTPFHAIGRILMRKRATLKNSKSSNETQNLSIPSKIEDIEQIIKHSHEEQRRMEENQAIENMKHKPKFFYSYCKEFLKSKSQIGPLVTDQGTTTDDPRETCQMLAHQYNSVFSIPKKQSDPRTYNLFQLSDHEPDPTYRPSGDDKEEIPGLLKQAIISPIYKGGDRTLPKNYRPVALTSHIIKVTEKCVSDKLFTYLEVKNLIKENEDCFRKGRSCLSNLLAHYDWLLRNLSEGKNVDVVFLDFAKFFDKVDHGVLLHKARDLEISGKLRVWLHNFLTDRTQTVAVDGVKSSDSKVISGVPQGSVLCHTTVLGMGVSVVDKLYHQDPREGKRYYWHPAKVTRVQKSSRPSQKR